MTLTSSLRDRVARPVVAVVAHATGVACLTLGAGIGYPARAHGLPCRTATSAEHQPAMVVAGGIEWPPALVAASGG